MFLRQGLNYVIQTGLELTHYVVRLAADSAAVFLLQPRTAGFWVCAPRPANPRALPVNTALLGRGDFSPCSSASRYITCCRFHHSLRQTNAEYGLYILQSTTSTDGSWSVELGDLSGLVSKKKCYNLMWFFFLMFILKESLINSILIKYDRVFICLCSHLSRI